MRIFFLAVVAALTASSTVFSWEPDCSQNHDSCESDSDCCTGSCRTIRFSSSIQIFKPLDSPYASCNRLVVSLIIIARASQRSSHVARLFVGS
ncbi:uncharacterized protein EDB91DRAFT_1140449 [Suillus paluster]|uniref:uncharacterized protein n=1 Tax=Suillus paluster TaxID=48578 RepID=UPI001B8866BD|nr:uncharacterized protein EDB91DRAFT_1140449 [Suillus paluster]KAG1737530.1 hypothetical protein EDB91DRAFT_1140449 [Suillus paluster]